MKGGEDGVAAGYKGDGGAGVGDGLEGEGGVGDGEGNDRDWVGFEWDDVGGCGRW